MQGAIWKRTGKRGVSYTARVDLGTDPVTGKRRQRAETFRTRKEAEAALAKWVTDIDRGLVVDSANLTVAEYLDKWLGSLEGIEASSKRRYSDLVRLHIKPWVGARPLAKLSPLDVQKLYADAKSSGLSATTISLLHNCLHRALKQAVDWDLIARNVTERVKAPRPKAPEPTTWDAAQVARFLAVAAEHEYAALWRVAIVTGMRRGELLGLQWRDVDFGRGGLNLRQQRRRGEGNAYEDGKPKSAKGRRAIALPPSAVESLRAHRKRQAEQRLALGPAYRDSGYVFAWPDGRPLHPNTLDRLFKRLVAAAGLPRLRLHDLRHTNATVSLAAGEHPKIVQERLGHSTISMTLDRYSHVTESMQRESALRLEALLEAAGEMSQLAEASSP